MFRELAVSYLGRHDLAHVDQSDFSNTALGKGIQEGKTNPFSTGWTRGHKPTLIQGGQTERSSIDRSLGEAKGSATATPSKGSSVSNISAFAGSAARKLETTVAISSSEVVSFKRDYEERAVEFAEEISEEVVGEADQAVTALFNDKAEAEAAAAKAEAKKIENERRMRSIAPGLHRQHVLGVPELHHGAQRHLREVRHLRRDQRLQLSGSVGHERSSSPAISPGWSTIENK